MHGICLLADIKVIKVGMWQSNVNIVGLFLSVIIGQLCTSALGRTNCNIADIFECQLMGVCLKVRLKTGDRAEFLPAQDAVVFLTGGPGRARTAAAMDGTHVCVHIVAAAEHLRADGTNEWLDSAVGPLVLA